MGIRTRLFVVVLGVWLSAAAGFGLLAWNLHQQKANADLRQVQEYAEGINRVVERELGKRVVLARTLAASRAVREGDLPRFHDEATAATQGTDNWALLVEPAALRANTLTPFDPSPVPRTRPRPLISQGTAFLFVPKGPVSGKPVITAVVPVEGVSPQRYNVGVAFEVASLQRLLTEADAPAQALTSIVDAEQYIMARSRDPDRWIGESASPTFKQRILQRGHGFAESTTLDGTPSLTYLTPPNTFGWSVVVAIPKAVLDGAARKASMKAMGASGVMLLLLLVSAGYGARALSRSAEQLSLASQALGNNQVPPPMSSGVREFDEVAAALHNAGLKAQEATRVLEQRVEEAVRAEADAQAKLLQSQKLELVGRLTAGVAHDFNNLLQTMTTAHQVLKPRLSDERDQRLLSSAVRATSKAAELVRQMMMLGRAHALKPAPLHIADAVLKGQELTSKAVGRDVALTAAIQADLPAVFVDPTQFDMALLNLVFNARDAMPAGGSIHITARLARDGEAVDLAPGPYVRLEVADTGAGMAPETAARAFEPFFTTKPVGAGTGLGLAQVHAFAHHSGGSVQLDSAPGKGTRVALYLPVSDQAPVPGADPAPLPSPSVQPGLKVLMVEDDALVSSVVSSALRAVGHEVHLCHNADEAVAVLEARGEVDVLLTDVIMPGGMNGAELVEWASRHRPDVRAIVMTGYADNLSGIKAPVLRKPFELATLQGLLAQAQAPADVP